MAMASQILIIVIVSLVFILIVFRTKFFAVTRLLISVAHEFASEYNSAYEDNDDNCVIDKAD